VILQIQNQKLTAVFHTRTTGRICLSSFKERQFETKWQCSRREALESFCGICDELKRKIEFIKALYEKVSQSFFETRTDKQTLTRQ